MEADFQSERGLLGFLAVSFSTPPAVSSPRLPSGLPIPGSLGGSLTGWSCFFLTILTSFMNACNFIASSLNTNNSQISLLFSRRQIYSATCFSSVFEYINTISTIKNWTDGPFNIKPVSSLCYLSHLSHWQLQSQATISSWSLLSLLPCSCLQVC